MVKNRVLTIISILILLFQLNAYGESTTVGNAYIGSWTMSFIESIYDPAKNLTSFKYTLSGTTYYTSDSRSGKNLSHLVISLDNGMTVNNSVVDLISTPTWSVGSDPTTGAYGIKFDDGQPLNILYTYTFYLDGHWSTSIGSFFLKAGSNKVSDSVIEGKTLIPGEIIENETFSISGLVFIDSNRNNIYDLGEPYLADALVGIDGLAETTTDGEGIYVFSSIPSGTYNVRFDISRSSSSSIQSLIPFLNSNNPVQSVTVGPDQKNVNFGLQFDLAKVFDYLYNENSASLGKGKTIGFWKHQFTVYATNRGKAQILKQDLDVYVQSVNLYHLKNPFYIASYQDALVNLSYNGPDMKLLMLKQLLATQLNKFSGLGLANSTLMNLILMHAEFQANQSSFFSRSELELTKNTLDFINNLGE